MKTFKRTLVLLAVCMLPVCMSARTEKETPAYRQKGYAGSVDLTGWNILFFGLETSHGYMFNGHHYLGGGLGAHFCPIFFPDMIGVFEPFIEYKAYFLKRGSTPTASLRAGYCVASFFHPELDEGTVVYAEGISPFLCPTIGWDWGLKSGRGLSLNVGVQIMTNQMELLLAPKLSFGFCF